MRNVSYLCLVAWFCAFTLSVARADNKAPTSKYGEGDTAEYDKPKKKGPTPEELEAIQEQMQEQKNWLLRNYVEQMKVKELAGQDHAEPVNLYDEISSNKDLAKLAGISFIAAPDPAAVAKLRAGMDAQKGLSLRLDPNESASGGPNTSHAKGPGFRPLITPLTATDAAGLHDFYSTLPAGSPPTVLPPVSSPPTDTPVVTNQDPVAVETPGLTAAESRVGEDKLSLDLALQPLPDEPPRNPPPHQDTSSLPQPPSANVADQLHKVTLTLSPRKTARAPVNTLLLNPDATDKPAALPPMSTGRPQIHDPFDPFN